MSATGSTSFPLGVFVGNPDDSDPSSEAAFVASYDSFKTLMGAQALYTDAFVDASQPIADWLSNASWMAGSFEASSVTQNMIPVIGLPMSSTAAGSPSADQVYKNFAAGDYDSMLAGMVKAWAADGYKTQYWRPGVEMNLTSSPSYAGATTAEQADWIAAFQHIYTVLHSAAQADGVNLKVMWNPGITNSSDAGNATQTLYPGNSYVDVIGANVYGEIYPYGTPTALYDWDKSGQVLNSSKPVYDSSVQQWASDPINLEHYYTYPASDQWSLDGSGGDSLSLENLITFAKAQGKPIAIGETGAGNTGDGAGVSDNPTFVQWLSSTLQSSGVDVEFVNIWDSNGGGTYEFSNASDDKPLEAAAWAKYFGAEPATTTTSTGSSTTTSSSTPTDDTLALQISEDAWQGDAEFTVDVNGKQVGGVMTASTLHASGDAGTVLLTGEWNSGVNDVTVNFINDAYGGSASEDRNLYVNSVAFNGVTYAGTQASIFSDSSHTFAVGGATATAAAPADTITLNLSEDAWDGNAEFVLYIDGKAVTTPQVVTALHDASTSQSFTFTGAVGAGTHTVGVGFVNDAYGGSSGEDRNLYVNGVMVNGSQLLTTTHPLYSNGVASFAVTTQH